MAVKLRVKRIAFSDKFTVGPVGRGPHAEVLAKDKTEALKRGKALLKQRGELDAARKKTRRCEGTLLASRCSPYKVAST